MVTVEVSCFTDIQGYSSAEERLGHRENQEIVNEFLRVGGDLIHLNGGKYHKNIGDAHMATFTSLEGPLRFATELQQMYTAQPCLERPLVGVRVSLCLDVIEPVSSEVFGTDAFGRGVIKAQRQESQTEPGSVTVNEELMEKISATWGQTTADRYFKSIGERELKGLERTEELFTFDWQSYAAGNPRDSLAQRVFECFDKGNVVLANLSIDGLTPPGVVIWPVVPRAIATAIHRGQIEILRLFAFLGWKIHLLIADCGPASERDLERVESFRQLVQEHALSRGVCISDTSKLSDYFEPSYQELSQALDWFQRTTYALTVRDLIDINQKEYSEKVRDEIKANSALYFLRPVLTCAAVSHLAAHYRAQNLEARTVVVCGLDEQIQWSTLLDLPYVRKCLSIVYNPILRESNAEGTVHTARQRADWPIWYSRHELQQGLEGSNIAKWLFQLFAQLPCFPSPFVPARSSLGNDEPCMVENWKDEFSIPEWVDRDRLVDVVWPIIDTARGQYGR